MIPSKLEVPGEVVREVSAAGYARLLGYPPDHEPDGQSRLIMRQAREWCVAHARPVVRLKHLTITKLNRKTVEWESSRKGGGGAGLFRSETRATRLRRAEAHAMVAVQISSGPEIAGEVEFLTGNGEVVEATMLDRYGAALVEWLVYFTEEHLGGVAHAHDLSVLPAMSPGHEDWTLRDQRWLLGSFGPRSRSVELLESGMLRPVNSLLAVFGLTHARHRHEQADSIPCQRCSWTPCTFRRKVEGALIAD
jgi:hypothetical protein